MKPEFSIIIPLINRASIDVNFEPAGLNIFRDHNIHLSGLPKKKITKRGTDLRLNLLLENLKSLRKFINNYNFEVIIVDFGSKDYNKKKLISDYEELNLKIVEEKRFFSRGYGLNVGFKYVTKNNILYCDADMYFYTDEIFKSAINELNKNKVFFPVCFDLIEPSHQIGYWRETGYGIFFIRKKLVEERKFLWSEYNSLGKEDEDAFNFFKKDASRYRVNGYYHQWHPSSKFFKNQFYKSGSKNYTNAIKILINFDDTLLPTELLKEYYKYLKNDKNYILTKKLEADTNLILNLKNEKKLVDNKIIKEYEKKYCRFIKQCNIDKLKILPKGYNYFKYGFPDNALWLNKFLDWSQRIAANDYEWTLNGNNNLKLSSLSLFSKLVKIYGKFFNFDKMEIRNLILKYLRKDGMFNCNGDKIKIISESRQAYSALINLGFEIRGNNKYQIDMNEYFPEPLYFMNDNFWKNPWRAGAHLSHYVFFCYLSKFDDKIINIFNQIDKKYRNKDGWYIGSPTVEQKINGLMKILTAYDIIGKKLDKEIVPNIVNLLIKERGCKGGCGIYDYVYVLVRCLGYGYREREIREILFEIYDKILEHQVEDGGFKYNKDRKKKDVYSGSVVGFEGEIGCIHGSVVFSMALSLINHHLNLGLGLELAFS